jgi:hypothetical protein
MTKYSDKEVLRLKTMGASNEDVVDCEDDEVPFEVAHEFYR